jgi:hypothetical protein
LRTTPVKNKSTLKIGEGTENERAALIRKIIWAVLIREEFLFRPEKAYKISPTAPYCDSSVRYLTPVLASVFAICEGNPRQIIGLIEPMLNRQTLNPTVEPRLHRSVQKQLIEKNDLGLLTRSSQLFRLRRIFERGFFGGYDFCDWKLLSEETVLGREFNPDPVLSFEDDDDLPMPVRELVGRVYKHRSVCARGRHQV